MTTTMTTTTVDFGPLLALRAEYDQIGDDLCRRIDGGDPVAVDLGEQLYAREDQIRDELEAQLQSLYRPSWNDDRQQEITLSDAFGELGHYGFDATGELHAHLDAARHRREQEALVDAREQIRLALEARHDISPGMVGLVLRDFDQWIDAPTST